jgi:hypothetical protein
MLTGAVAYFFPDIKFEQALSKRRQSLGNDHLHVARSAHKLARNYVKLANLLPSNTTDEAKNKLYCNADAFYKEALAIFEKNNISVQQVKHKELADEYEEFKKNFSNLTCIS